MARYTNWYLIEIRCQPRSRYTVSDKQPPFENIPWPCTVERTFRGKTAEQSARAESQRLNNEADRA